MAITFTRTRNQIAQRVLGKVVKIGDVSIAEANYTLVFEAIDLRLKEIHSLGIFWRKVTRTPLSFTITANISSASSSVDVLFPISMHVVDGSQDEPVDLIGIREYAAINNKAETGLPTKALYNGSAEFIFWPVPTAATTAKLVYERIADDTSASAAVDVDVAMIRPLVDIIKYDVADDYGIPEPTQARWEREAAKAQIAIRRLSVERVDPATVVIDDFAASRGSTETDYEA